MRVIKNIMVLALLVSFSCSANQNQIVERKEKGIILDLDNKRKNTADIFLYSSMYKDVKTIILETNDSCLIGSLFKMWVYDPYIIVMDSHIAKSLFLFDMTGRFIRKIGRFGKGPGEYITLDDFTVDKENDIIYILDGHSNKINKYELSTGRFIRSILIMDKDVRSNRIVYIGGKFFADARYFKYSRYNNLIRLIDESSGKILDQFLNVDEYGKGILNVFYIFQKAFYMRQNGNFVYVNPFMDKIIELSKESVSTLFEIKSKDLMPANIIKSAIADDPRSFRWNLMMKNDKYFEKYDFVEHPNLIKFTINKREYLHLIVYDKLTKEVSVFPGRRDDLIYTQETDSKTPLLIPMFGCNAEHGVYYYVNTGEITNLKELAIAGILSPKLDKIEAIKQLEEDANPVILYYEFKD